MLFWIRDLIVCLPGYYYYRTRYDNGWPRLFHVVKYWGVYPLLIVLLDMWNCYSWVYGVALWVGFLNIYDVFCYDNDMRAVRTERRPCRRSAVFIARGRFWGIKAAVQIGIIGGLWLVAGRGGMLWAGLGLYGLLIAVFGLHNQLGERCRFVTLYLLYLLKAGVWLVPAFGGGMDMWREYWMFALVFNASYVPQYFMKKTLGREPERVRVKVIVTPFTLKLAGMVILMAWRPVFGYVLIYLVAATGLEWLSDRMAMRGKLAAEPC